MRRESREDRSCDRESRAFACEEPKRILLCNGLMTLAFSTANGTLISVHDPDTQTELVEAVDAAAEGLLWRVDMTGGDGAVASITNRDAEEFSFSIERDEGSEGSGLSLRWSGLRIGGTLVEGQAGARILMPAESPFALFEFKVQLPGHLSVSSVAFPCLCALGSQGQGNEDAVFLPLSGGVLIRKPRAARRSPGKAFCSAVYPGAASLQMVGYSSGRNTVWLAGRDACAAQKTMMASGTAHSNRLALWIVHRPTCGERQTWRLGYPVALGLVQGDWFEAARQYRAWALREPWCARGSRRECAVPTLTSSYGLWLSHWGPPRACVGAAREVQRIVNIPIKLDWRCWHKCVRDGAYPDYFPPREGEEAFARARRQLSEAGVLTQLSFSGLHASPESEAWEVDEWQRWALAASRESDSGRAPGHSGSELVPMCPSTRFWQGWLGTLAQEAVRYGANGVYLEDLAASGPWDCEGRDHEHGRQDAAQWGAAVRAALTAVRTGMGEGIQLAADGPVEAYLDLVDAFLCAHPAAEREGALPRELEEHCEPIPLFSAVYHDYTTLIGPPVSLVNHRPHDPFWPASRVAELQLPEYLMRRDFEAQFCVEVARAISWGQHPVLTNYSGEQGRQENSRRRLAFLAAALRAQAWGVGALLPFAEFMGLLEVQSPMLDVDFLVNPAGGSAEERHSLRLSIHPVLGSAWRTPGGGLALVLVNVHQQLLEFAARLPSSRLSLEPPLHVVGRAFSEDGDAPAPSLLVSGTEISGRLPGRCVLLITLR